jgi:hypothetical protein
MTRATYPITPLPHYLNPTTVYTPLILVELYKVAVDTHFFFHEFHSGWLWTSWRPLSFLIFVCVWPSRCKVTADTS